MNPAISALMRAGGSPTADQWNKLVRFVARRITGVGCIVDDKDSGIVIRVNGTQENAPDLFRFKLGDASTTDGEGVKTPKVKLVPGTVDSISPTVGGIAMDTDPRPTLELNSNVKNIVVLKVTFTADTYTAGGYDFLISNGTITAPQILVYDDGSVPADVEPTPTDPEGTYYTRIGFVDVNENGDITAMQNDGVRTSLVSHYCAGNPMWYSMI